MGELPELAPALPADNVAPPGIIVLCWDSSLPGLLRLPRDLILPTASLLVITLSLLEYFSLPVSPIQHLHVINLSQFGGGAGETPLQINTGVLCFPPLWMAIC